VAIEPGTFRVANASCYTGEKVIGGGYQMGAIFSGESPPIVTSMVSVPINETLNTVGWQIEVYNPGKSTKEFVAYAECLTLIQ
jgi:hypothetical protein